MARSLGIDIGSDAIRGALLRGSMRKLDVERYLEIPLAEPEGSPGRLPELAEAGRNLLAAAGVTPDTIVASIAGEEASLRTVELPIAVVHTAPAADRVHPNDDAAAPPALPVAMLAGLDILVVDDDADTLDTVRVLLEQSGARVRAAGSVREALETMSSRVPDLLISDIGMPDEDGYALIRKVRALDPEHGGRVPALALTAYARVEDRLQVLSAGFQMHVPKPIEPAELIAVVGNLAEWMPKDGRRQT